MKNVKHLPKYVALQLISLCIKILGSFTMSGYVAIYIVKTSVQGLNGICETQCEVFLDGLKGSLINMSLCVFLFCVLMF